MAETLRDRLNRVVFLTALLFLAIYMAFTLADALTRGDVDPVRGQYVTGSAAAGTATPAAPRPAHRPRRPQRSSAAPARGPGVQPGEGAPADAARASG